GPWRPAPGLALVALLRVRSYVVVTQPWPGVRPQGDRAVGHVMRAGREAQYAAGLVDRLLAPAGAGQDVRQQASQFRHVLRGEIAGETFPDHVLEIGRAHV